MRINKHTWLWVAAIAACLIVGDIHAQPPGGRGGREGRGGRGAGGG